MTIVRNLYIVNGFPCLPARTCRKTTGPGEVSLIARGRDQHDDGGRDQEQEGADAVDDPLDQQRPGDIRRGPENEHRTVPDGVEIGPRNRGLDEIREQPGLDSLDLARGDRLLEAIQVAMAAGENHARNRVPVQRLDQRGDRLRLDIDPAHDFHLDQLLGGQAFSRVPSSRPASPPEARSPGIARWTPSAAGGHGQPLPPEQTPQAPEARK